MKFFCYCCLFLFSNVLLAQLPDSLNIPVKVEAQVDTSQISAKLDSLLQSDLPVAKKKNFIGRFFDRKDYPNPKKALFLSLILPGSGQFYNKQYLKVPIVAGLYTAGIVNISNRRAEFKFYRDNRIAELDGDPNTINITGFDEQSLRSLRDNALTNAETGFLILLVIHALQAADAFVFAHLKTFDVSEDLSLRISPQMGVDQQQQLNAGLQVALSFSNKKVESPRPF